MRGRIYKIDHGEATPLGEALARAANAEVRSIGCCAETEFGMRGVGFGRWQAYGTEAGRKAVEELRLVLMLIGRAS